MVSGARRRALRDGDRQIDTAHLLHSLLEHDPEVRAVFEGGPQLARLLAYLVQRSIGYGLRWQGSVEDSGAVPLVTEADGLSPLTADGLSPLAADGLSPLAAGAMEYAHERAAGRGADRANGVDLLAAVVTDPEARAVEVLTRAGIDAEALLSGLEGRVPDAPWPADNH
ncbi:ClpA/ClpB-like protein [Streptomyces sp. TLI_55]|nr:ClpA/ClpB-like protein [Streptomyces sp. TLI_55]